MQCTDILIFFYLPGHFHMELFHRLLSFYFLPGDLFIHCYLSFPVATSKLLASRISARFGVREQEKGTLNQSPFLRRLISSLFRFSCILPLSPNIQKCWRRQHQTNRGYCFISRVNSGTLAKVQAMMDAQWSSFLMCAMLLEIINKCSCQTRTLQAL